jgi:hypothetical protein
MPRRTEAPGCRRRLKSGLKSIVFREGLPMGTFLDRTRPPQADLQNFTPPFAGQARLQNEAIDETYATPSSTASMSMFHPSPAASQVVCQKVHFSFGKRAYGFRKNPVKSCKILSKCGTTSRGGGNPPQADKSTTGG